MKTTLSKIASTFKTVLAPPAKREFWAFLGDISGQIKANEFGDVYVIDFGGNVMQVYNERVPLLFRRPVIVGYRDEVTTRLEVLRFVDAYPDYRKPSVPNHAEAHQWAEHDIVWVRPEQLLTCGFVNVDNATLLVEMVGGWIYLDSEFHVVGNQVIDFTDDLPVTGAYYALVEIDADLVVSKRFGSVVANKETLVPADIPVLVSNKKPLFAVVLYADQEAIKVTPGYTDIVDMRFAGIASGGSATAIVWDDVLDKPDTFPSDKATWDAIYGIGEGHTHAVMRWTADGATTNFELPDYAESAIVYDHALRVDPLEAELSADGGQVVFADAPSAGHIVTSDYVIKRF